MANRLAEELSPYLRQHAENPVDWYPWCAEALERARRERKPIFLSIGYSACHWCHVMAEESFEDEEIARLLNEHFVPVKLDREERPDLDHIYMEAVHVMTGRGGWPLSVFLTPELEPFFGGTYWPPRATGPVPGFLDVLKAVHEAWQQRGDELAQHAKQVVALVNRQVAPIASGKTAPLGADLPAAAEAGLQQAYDPTHGGFGTAPKFPQPMQLRLLLRRWYATGREEPLQMVTHSLEQMAAGGIHDQLGGGFHRYSTDGEWQIPHFEKMLYDNAQLATVYLEAWQATARPEFAAVCRNTLDYMLRDLAEPHGGFAASEDADSQGSEGTFYVWTCSEVQSLLGSHDAELFAAAYGITVQGNFDGRNVLSRRLSLAHCAERFNRPPERIAAELAGCRRCLLQARNQRERPARDNKVIVAWNALAIEALAAAGAALGETRYIEAAIGTARFLLSGADGDHNTLPHYCCAGQWRQEALLDDYAALAWSLIVLYQATFDERWLSAAIPLVEAMLERFYDRARNVFYYTAGQPVGTIARRVDLFDGAVPSGSGMAVMSLIWLAELCGRNEWQQVATAVLHAASGTLSQLPLAAGQLLLAADTHLAERSVITMLGNPQHGATAEVLRTFRSRFAPYTKLALRDAPLLDDGNPQPADPLFTGKQLGEREPAVYLCQGNACRAPQWGPEAAQELVVQQSRQHESLGE